MSGGPGDRRGEFERVGERASREILRHEVWAAALRAIRVSSPWVVVGPAVALLVHAGERLVGAGQFAVPLEVMIGSAVLPSLLFAGIAVATHLMRSADPISGLEILDHELRAADRMRTAHDFLGHRDLTPFEAAAVEDGEAMIERARAHALARSAAGEWDLRVVAFWALAALLVVFGMSTAPRGERPEPRPTVGGGGTKVAEASSPRADSRKVPAPDKSTEVARDARTDRKSEAATRPAATSRPTNPEPELAERKSSGKTGDGKSSAAATPANQSTQSQGFPSSPSETNDKPTPTKTVAKAPKPKPPPKPGDPPKKKVDEPSGSTAGRGVGSGASKNPGATEWASKDQVTDDREDPPEDEVDVDEEMDESENRGGVQPSLRDRRPAVNRDLTIGFGNRPSPDANGRGGPSQEQKKSRGVASLVLGVPIPDHVKGKPGPGRTKITQERVEPRPEDAAPADALARAPRAGKSGQLAHPDLAPWMREVVRRFFVSQRQLTKEQERP